MFTQKEMELLNRYANAIFGCSFDDLSDKEQIMLIAHVRDREPDFQNRRGLV